MTARSIFNARLIVGPLELGVRFHTAVEDRSVHFRLLHAADQQPVVQELIDKTTEQPVGRDEVRKAYELDDGRLVKLGKDELEGIEPAASRAITVSRFVPSSCVDPTFYDRPYYLSPDGDDEGYFALARALAQRQCEGLARWVMRKRRYAGALREHEGHLVVLTLRHAEEVVDLGALRRSDTRPFSAQEARLASQLIDAFGGSFEPDLFQDEYRARVEELARSKASGKVVAFPSPKKKAAAASNLADALEKSLSSAKRRSA